MIFFEHKKLYKTKGDLPEEEYSIPFGKGNVVREGHDMTVVAISNMVRVAQEAADDLKAQHNFELEIIDPRTIVPLDLDLIGESIKKTNTAVIVEEGVLRGGVGSDIASQIHEQYFDELDFPVTRIASKNVPIPMPPLMEQAVIPNKDRLVHDICALVGL